MRDERLTCLSAERLESLGELGGHVEARGVRGDIVECGVALEGSAILLAHHSRIARPPRRFADLDLFGQILPPGERDAADAHERYAVIASDASGASAASATTRRALT